MEAMPRTSGPPAALDRLRQEVLDAGRCVACGACLGLCPYLVFYDGLVAAPHDCGLVDGRCYQVCPQALEPGPDAKRREVLAAEGRALDAPLGPVSGIWWARSADAEIRERGQYGGVVSTLLSHALAAGVIEEAVLTRAGLRGAPSGARVKDHEGVMSAARSIYAAGGALRELNQALAEPEAHPLGLVGLPCQSLAALTMRNHAEFPAASQRLKLIIGLFCTLNLSARGLRSLLAEAGVDQPVLKSDFPPPPAGVMQVTTADGLTEIPLDKVDRAVLGGCHYCPDLTAEAADISVGAAEGRPGLNTVIARSEQGKALIESANKEGLIELLEPEQEFLDHLEQAAANKRQRATAAAEEANA
jgi:coenzyme F420 hydrogenase subunit beta